MQSAKPETLQESAPAVSENFPQPNSNEVANGSTAVKKGRVIRGKRIDLNRLFNELMRGQKHRTYVSDKDLRYEGKR